MSAKARYTPRNVLVVEDNADDVELLRLAAEAAPDAVAFHIVGDGEKALAYLKGEGQYADRPRCWGSRGRSPTLGASSEPILGTCPLRTTSKRAFQHFSQLVGRQ